MGFCQGWLDSLDNCEGTSANAGPHYQKLYGRVTHVWGNRRGQPNRTAMEGPHPGRNALLITLSSPSGKYELAFSPLSTRRLQEQADTCGKAISVDLRIDRHVAY